MHRPVLLSVRDVQLTVQRCYAEWHEAGWHGWVNKFPLHIGRLGEVRIEHVNFVVMQVSRVDKGRAIYGSQRQTLVHCMSSTVDQAVVVRRDRGCAAVFCPRCMGPPLTVKDKQCGFLATGRRNHEAAAAVVHLARGIGRHAGCGCRQGNADVVRACYLAGLNHTRAAVQGGQVAVVVRNPERQARCGYQAPGIRQIGVNCGDGGDESGVARYQSRVAEGGSGCLSLHRTASTGAGTAAATARGDGEGAYDAYHQVRRHLRFEKSLLFHFGLSLCGRSMDSQSHVCARSLNTGLLYEQLKFWTSADVLGSEEKTADRQFYSRR